MIEAIKGELFSRCPQQINDGRINLIIDEQVNVKKSKVVVGLRISNLVVGVGIGGRYYDVRDMIKDIIKALYGSSLAPLTPIYGIVTNGVDAEMYVVDDRGGPRKVADGKMHEVLGKALDDLCRRKPLIITPEDLAASIWNWYGGLKCGEALRRPILGTCSYDMARKLAEELIKAARESDVDVNSVEWRAEVEPNLSIGDNVRRFKERRAIVGIAPGALARAAPRAPEAVAPEPPKPSPAPVTTEATKTPAQKLPRPFNKPEEAYSRWLEDYKGQLRYTDQVNRALQAMNRNDAVSACDEWQKALLAAVAAGYTMAQDHTISEAQLKDIFERLMDAATSPADVTPARTLELVRSTLEAGDAMRKVLVKPDASPEEVSKAVNDFYAAVGEAAKAMAALCSTVKA